MKRPRYCKVFLIGQLSQRSELAQDLLYAVSWSPCLPWIQELGISWEESKMRTPRISKYIIIIQYNNNSNNNNSGHMCAYIYITLFTCGFSRMRSEGFSFYFGGLGAWGLGGWDVFARRRFHIRNHPQPSATVCNRSR